MRKVEFRGYDPDTERWYYGSYVRLERSTRYPMSPDTEGAEKKFQAEQVDHYIFFTESSDWGLPTRKLRATVDPASVGQYIGERDKNKHKIYEGDIVWVEGDDIEDGEFKVIYSRYTWAFESYDTYKPFTDYSSKTGELYKIEVIGNTYKDSNE
jgi:uncharacterized phage protein (TIGR01671 family)